MSLQEQRRRLLEQEDGSSELEASLIELGADEELINFFGVAVEKGLISPEEAIALVKEVLGLSEQEGGATFTPGVGEQHASARAFKKMKGWKDAPSIPNRLSGAMDYKQLWEGENYARFRNETKTRSKSEQYHQAVKAANRKLQEVHRIFEFTSRLKQELAEEALVIKEYTRKSLEKAKTTLAEIYKKLKTL